MHVTYGRKHKYRDFTILAFCKLSSLVKYYYLYSLFFRLYLLPLYNTPSKTLVNNIIAFKKAYLKYIKVINIFSCGKKSKVNKSCDSHVIYQIEKLKEYFNSVLRALYIYLESG
jgi:hypothetical protein